MSHHRSKTYYKFLFSYLALLLVGVLALSVAGEVFLSRRLKASIKDTQQEIARQTAQELDSNVQQIYSIDYQITSDNENFLSNYLIEDSPVRDLWIVHELKRMLSPVDFLADIALYSPDSNDVYTSVAAYASDIYFNSIFVLHDWPDLPHVLQNLPRRTVLPATTVNRMERYVTFINTPSVFSRLDSSVLLFFVKESKFISRLSSEENMSRNGAILDSEGRLIVSSLQVDPAALKQADDSLLMNGTRYLVLREQSKLMDWTYYTLFKMDEVYSPLYAARMTLFALSGFMTLMGLLLILYFMRVNYRPLKALSLAFGGSQTGDEFKSLQDAIHDLSSQNETMRRKLMSSPDGQALKDALLFSLFKGKFSSFAEFNREGAPLEMAFIKPHYQVLMLRLSKQENQAVSRKQLEDALEKALGGQYTWHFRELFEPSMMVCLVGMEEGRENDLSLRCKQLMTILAESHNQNLTIGASNSYQDIRSLSTAYFEATQALNEHFMYGSQQFIRYEQLSRKLLSPSNPLQELDKLKEQTPAQQMQTIRSFIDHLKEKQTPSLLAKSYCNYAVQLLLSSAPAGAHLSDLFSISYLHTVDDYSSFMMRLLSVSMQKTEQAARGTGPENELLNRILRYISENNDNYDFSIQDVAEHLNINSSYMSQYFKQQTGDTLNNYITDLRMQKARTLLETTTMPLQMVAESVGYYNLNSFIRRFKQIFGITPGEYRHTY